jgi:hypothetical protein
MDLKKGHYVNGGKIKRPWEQLMSQASPTNKALANMDSYSQNILNDGYIDIVDIDTDMDMDDGKYGSNMVQSHTNQQV